MNSFSYTTNPYPLADIEVDKIIAATQHDWAVALNDNPVKHPGIIYLMYAHHLVGKGRSRLSFENKKFAKALVAHGFTPRLYTILTLLFQRRQLRGLWDRERHGHLMWLWRETDFWPHLPRPGAWHEWIIRVNEGESVNVVFAEMLDRNPPAATPAPAPTTSAPLFAGSSVTRPAPCSAQTPQEIEHWDSGQWLVENERAGLISPPVTAESARRDGEGSYPPIQVCECKNCSAFNGLELQEYREARARRILAGLED